MNQKQDLIDDEILTDNYNIKKIMQSLILIKIAACSAVTLFYLTLILVLFHIMNI